MAMMIMDTMAIAIPVIATPMTNGTVITIATIIMGTTTSAILAVGGTIIITPVSASISLIMADAAIRWMTITVAIGVGSGTTGAGPMAMADADAAMDIAAMIDRVTAMMMTVAVDAVAVGAAIAATMVRKAQRGWFALR